MNDNLICPFCGVRSHDGEYGMLLHLEALHSEDKSPFIADEIDNSPEPHQAQLVECPVDGCGEFIWPVGLDYHLELHAGERDQQCWANPGDASDLDPQENVSRPQLGDSFDDTANCDAERSLSVEGETEPGLGHSRQATSTAALKIQAIGGTSQAPEAQKQLGKAELGKYAHEQQMPDWLVSLLLKGGEVTSAGVISVISKLLQQSKTTEYAYLCHPSVHHVTKLRREGGFCGYRNIQMMVSYIVGTSSPGAASFDEKLPTIFEIQDMIETAWDLGINSQGRVETGGIRGTRKYIGTPEAEALFRSLGIPCSAEAFKDPEPRKSEAKLLKSIEQYFQQGEPKRRDGDKVVETALPPIYFQHPGHSLTIVGLERQRNGRVNLLVFDPMFRDAASISRLLRRTVLSKHPDEAIKPYRRGGKYLQRYREFEILRLSGGTGTIHNEDMRESQHSDPV